MTSLKKKSSARLQEFCEDTTAHGLANVVRRKSKVKITLWICAVIIVPVACVLHMYSVVNNFFEYKVQEKFKSEYKPDELKFPSVSICNLTPMSSSSAELSLQPFLESLGIYSDGCENEFLIPDEFRNPIMAWRDINSPHVLYEYNTSIAELIGHQEHNFIVDCVYQSVPCGSSFTKFLHAIYFQCYTFDPPNNFTVSGPDGGLALALYLENEETSVSFGNEFRPVGEVGARVVIHERGTKPMPYHRGTTISVGQSTSVNIKPMNVTRKPHPYESNCTLQTTIEAGEKTYPYSRDLCIEKCYTDELAKECGCISLLSGSGFEHDDLPFCGSYYCNYSMMVDKYICLYIVYMNVNILKRVDCSHCKDPCQEIVYNIDVQQTKWPAKGALKSFIDQFQVKNTMYGRALRNMTLEKQRTYFEENFLLLSIYYGDYLVTQKFEEENYDLASLVSNIGGTFGFWIGISVVTVMEFSELILDLLLIGWTSLHKQDVQPIVPSDPHRN